MRPIQLRMLVLQQTDALTQPEPQRHIIPLHQGAWIRRHQLQIKANAMAQNTFLGINKPATAAIDSYRPNEQGDELQPGWRLSAQRSLLSRICSAWCRPENAFPTRSDDII